MRTPYVKPTTVRIRADIAEQIAAIADREGNSFSAVLRRVIALGLAQAERQRPQERAS